LCFGVDLGIRVVVGRNLAGSAEGDAFQTRVGDKMLGRAPKNVEFLRTLREITGLKPGQFAKACGKAPANMANYLSGALVPGKRVLASSLAHLHEWNVNPIMELEPIPGNLNVLPTTPGIYVFYDSAGNVLYIGKATNFRLEVRQTLGRKIPVAARFGPDLTKSRPKIRTIATFLSLYEVPSPRARHNIEALLIRVIPNQTHNSNIGWFD